jgi:hypothetical protein
MITDFTKVLFLYIYICIPSTKRMRTDISVCGGRRNFHKLRSGPEIRKCWAQLRVNCWTGKDDNV